MAEILLVGARDDALTNLQRYVAAQEPDWSVVHSLDNQGALERLRKRSSDIVLAGMETEQCELLFSEVGETAPGAIRLALSAAPAHLIRGAHQILARQSELDDLHQRLRAAVRVSSRSAGRRRLQRIISRFQEVPSPPQLYFDIREQLDSAAGTSTSMAEIASKDPALVARTLQIANSGFYARSGTVGDLVDAITLLGTETLLGLVLAAHLFSGMPPPGLKLDMLWRHSFSVSQLAREICRGEGGKAGEASHSFLAGLLHDIGLIVLFQNEPADYLPMWQAAQGDEDTLVDLEREAFEISHAELGSMVLTLWNLPERVVSAVAASHAGDLAPTDCRVSRAVLAAEWLLGRDCPATLDTLPAPLADTSAATLASWVDARSRLESGS
ncbi:MAG: HDOD domain-containing protein [Pseudomonadota bacterium]